MKLLICLFIIPAFAYQGDLIEKIGWFCSQHNFKFLSILIHNKLPYSHQNNKILMNKDLRVKSIVNVASQLEDQDFVVIFYTPDDDFIDWFSLSNRLIKSALFVVEQYHMDDFVHLISQKNLTFNIYCLVHNESLLEIKELIALKSQTKVIVRNTDGMEIDLQGIHVSSITGNWEPYVNTYDCDKFEKRCAIEGLSVDIMDNAAKIMNFTWTSDISNDWGMFPKSGPFNISGKWEGVMGNVVLGNYDVSVNYWEMKLERINIVDHVRLIKSDPKAILMKPVSVDLDLKFYSRPFESKLWIGIVLINIIYGVTYFTINTCSSNTSLKIMGFFMWIFFTLAHAFYGGALMMFFITESDVPFSNLDDAIMAFPNWNVIYESGNEAVYKEPARRVNSCFYLLNVESN